MEGSRYRKETGKLLTDSSSPDFHIKGFKATGGQGHKDSNVIILLAFDLRKMWHRSRNQICNRLNEKLRV
jgi:hypothetical protein